MSSSARIDALQDLIGREAESALLDALIDGLPGASGALIVHGEAGIGKPALLQRARERARAMGGRVLSTVGVESEVELAFAGLHQLLHPIISLSDRLSEAQRRAIDAAFGVSGETEPDPFRVSLAAFQLVCEAADSGPVVLIIDDAQWLDHSSMGALTFIARRLEGEPVAMVAAVRAGHATLLEEPSWYLIATNDEAIPPDAERMFAQRMGASTVEVASSHLAMVSHPTQVVELIEAAADATVTSPARQLPRTEQEVDGRTGRRPRPS